MDLADFTLGTFDTDTFIADSDDSMEVNPIIVIGGDKHMTHVQKREERENNDEEEILSPQRHIAMEGSFPIEEGCWSLVRNNTCSGVIGRTCVGVRDAD